MHVTYFFFFACVFAHTCSFMSTTQLSSSAGLCYFIYCYCYCYYYCFRQNPVFLHTKLFKFYICFTNRGRGGKKKTKKREKMKKRNLGFVLVSSSASRVSFFFFLIFRYQIREDWYYKRLLFKQYSSIEVLDVSINIHQFYDQLCLMIFASALCVSVTRRFAKEEREKKGLNR